jgi:hypothetical protein
LTITGSQIKGSNGQVDAELVARFLTMMHDHIGDATAPTRNDPFSQVAVVASVTLISGTVKSIRHGLGRQFKHYDVKRVYPTYIDTFGVTQPSAAPAYVEVALSGWPAGLTPDQYLVLTPLASGRYDFAVYPG